MTEELSQQEPQPPLAELQANSFAIPSVYAEKEWAKNIKSGDELWNQFANAQTLLGRRAIPTADAPDNEWDNFYKQAGRPDAPSGYTLPDIDGLPEGTDLSPFKEKASSILHAAGLNQKQAEKVWKQYVEAEMGSAEQVKARQAELDKEFDTVTQKIFGDDAPKIIEGAVSFANGIVPPELRDVAAGLADNPKALAYIAALAKGAQDKYAELAKKYGAEDSIAQGAVVPSGIDIMEVRQELAKLRHSPDIKNFGTAENKKAVGRMTELEQIIVDYYKK